MSSVVLGPSGGIGGQPFDDAPEPVRLRLGEVRVWATSAIEAIQCAHWRDGELIESPRHGTPVREPETLVLAQGEHITEIYGRYGSYIETLNVRTNLGNRRHFGGPGGHCDFLYLAPDGFQIVGFWGRAGRLIDALGVHLLPLSGG